MPQIRHHKLTPPRIPRNRKIHNRINRRLMYRNRRTARTRTRFRPRVRKSQLIRPSGAERVVCIAAPNVRRAT